MNQCPACGEAVLDTARFCSACGAVLAERPSSVRTNGRRGRCKYCGNEIAVGVNPCPHCGHELKWIRKPIHPTTAGNGLTSAETARQAETVDLAQDLGALGGWGFNNGLVTTFGSVFPGVGCLLGFLLLLLNPLWIVSSAVFYVIGTARLKKGDITGAQLALAHGRLTNWLLVVPCFVAWSLVFHAYQSGGAVYRMLHEPKVEVVQSASGPSATRPASPSIRAEMRQALTGGDVLQVWNTTDEPVTCTATLNNPELRTHPVYTFTAQPGAAKPQELGIKQFGHRIKKKPRCSVTIEVKETGEVYRFMP